MHVTEADSFLTAYQRYAVEPLTDDEADRYVEQTGVVAARARVRRPADHRGRAAGAASRPTAPSCESTAAAREAARFLLVHPPLPLAARPGYAALAAGAVAMLPRWARLPLRLPWLPVTERFVGRPLGGIATGDGALGDGRRDRRAASSRPRTRGPQRLSAATRRSDVQSHSAAAHQVWQGPHAGALHVALRQPRAHGVGWRAS